MFYKMDCVGGLCFAVGGLSDIVRGECNCFFRDSPHPKLEWLTVIA